MAYSVGANTRLAFKKESSYGTNPGGTDWLQMPFIPRADFGATQNLIDSPVIGIGPTRDPSDPFFDGIEAGGSFSVPLDKTEIGRWLQMALGAPTTTGSSDYTHVFKSGSTTLPSAALEFGFPGLTTSQYFLSLGCRVGEITLEAAPTGLAQMGLTLVAQGTTRGTSSVDASLTAPASYEQFNNFQAALEREASALAAITSMSLRFSNGLEPLRTIRGDQKIDEALPGGVAVTGSLTARFGDPSLLLAADAEGATPIALTLTYTISATKMLEIHIPRAFLPQRRQVVEGRQGVQAQYDFQGSYDASAGCALQVTLKNQTASY